MCLSLQTNNITRIPAGSLPKYLRTFTAFGNPISTIDDSAFSDSASTLEVLHLSNFRFRRIPDAFLNLTRLKEISFYDANILDWNINVMKNIAGSVITLDLQNVGLVGWPTWIQYFLNLTTLSLDNSDISSIPDQALDMLSSSLTTLSLNNNSLTSIPKAVSTLTALRWLLLSYNNIKDTTWLPQVSSIATLYLNYNQLFNATQLSLSLRPSAGTLTELDIIGNRLVDIPDLSFLKLIYGLDFTYNQISYSQIGPLPDTIYELNLGNNLLPRIPGVYQRLPNINYLSMSFNFVTELQAADFPAWISNVDLSFNYIVELTDTSFPRGSIITVLNLNNNPIATISNNAFNNLLQLTELIMRNTKISRLPIGLSVLTNIEIFEVDGSTDLVCTCMEKSLAPWILRLPNIQDSTCGLSTIYYFFFILSQSCP